MKERERGRRERDLPFISSLHRWPQQPGMGKAQLKSQECHQVSYVSGRVHGLESMMAAFMDAEY